MNVVALIGRLTRDADVRYTQEGRAVARFTLAIDRYSKDEKQTDYPNVVAFGKTAEIIEQYTQKGKQVAVIGSIHTGRYNDREGKTVYFTEVTADRVELLSSAENAAKNDENDAIDGFEYVDDELPF